MSKQRKGTKTPAPVAPVDICVDCGGGPVKRRRENWRMPLVGDWGVTLENVEVTHCRMCGGRGVSIERMGPLMRGIAAALARKHGRLAAPEVTFLRKHIDYTGQRLAKALGVTGSSVSRWENGHEPIGPVADRLLRALVVIHEHEADKFDVAEFEAIEDATGPMRMTLRQNAEGEWATAAA
jgi:putative zinc finger/helix-turn-helix YgiT family protein